MQPIDVLGTLFFIFTGAVLEILSAAIAKKLGVSPILGFALGVFCPGISLGVIIFLAKSKGRM